MFRDLDQKDLLLLGEGRYAELARAHTANGSFNAHVLELTDIAMSRLSSAEMISRLETYAPGRVFMVGRRPRNRVNGRGSRERVTMEDFGNLFSEHPNPRDSKNRKLQQRSERSGLMPSHLSEISLCGLPGAIVGEHPSAADVVAFEELRLKAVQQNADRLVIVTKDGEKTEYPYHLWTMDEVLEETGDIPGATAFLQYRETQNPFHTKFVAARHIKAALNAGIRKFCVCSPRIVFDDLGQIRLDCNSVDASIFRLSY